MYVRDAYYDFSSEVKFDGVNLEKVEMHAISIQIDNFTVIH